MKPSLLLVLAMLSLCSTAFGYKILCINPVPSRSHATLAKGIIKPLLKAGHEITWVTPFPDAKPVKNLRTIEVATRALADAVDMTDPKNGDISFVVNFAQNVSTVTAQNEELREILAKEQFDAVITEWFFSNTDAGYAAIQQVPWIMLSGTTLSPMLEELVDEVKSASTIPFMMLDFPVPMNFWQRVANFGIIQMMKVGDWLDRSATTARYEQYFSGLAAARGVALPAYEAALHDVSVLLVNSHPSIASAMSLPPNVVDIAGYHIDENVAPLPKDLQELMDSSPQGVVYFSMGSVLKSSALPQHTRRDLLQILGALPYTVLWKFEEKIEGIPKNVHVRPWWPQASILAHPNIKLFITHGGLLSTLEAVHYGVPLLAVPVFGDQPSNANSAVRAGYAVRVTFSPDMGSELKAALKEILENDSYYKTAKHLSDLFNSRPVPPAHLITHYVELAIRTKGAHHLRSKSLLYPWYQRWMLDFAAVVLLVLYVLYRTVRKIFSKLFRTSPRKEQKKQKKN